MHFSMSNVNLVNMYMQHFHTSDERSCLGYILYVAQLVGLLMKCSQAKTGQRLYRRRGRNRLWRSINTLVIRMHNFDFAMKTTQTESVLLSSPS